ncbi:MAG: VWA domain-containing protein, partial [Calditrichaeota bacterium]
MLKQLYLDFSIAGWIFFLLFWLLIAIAVYYYSRTLPPLSRFRRIFLTLLRSLVLIILFFILFQPVIQLIFEKQQKPAVAFLFDGSRSMQIEDSFGMRGDSLQIALEMVERSSLDDSIHVRIYQFSQNLKLLQQDTLNFDGGQTNISLALKSTLDSLLNYNIQNVVLLSDGQFNAGENPMNTVQNAPVPVYTVTVGDT